MTEPSHSSATITVFVSYSHDSEAHRERVLALADRLRTDGLDVRLDRYVAHPPEGWPRWSQKQIIEAHFVLLICTSTYRRRFERDETTGADKGVAWEALIADTVLYEANARNDKLIPVLFEGGREADVPVSLRPYARYELSDEQGYEALYRRLTNQPETPAPTRGKLRKLPPRQRPGMVSEGGAPGPVHEPRDDRSDSKPVPWWVGALHWLGQRRRPVLTFAIAVVAVGAIASKYTPWAERSEAMRPPEEADAMTWSALVIPLSARPACTNEVALAGVAPMRLRCIPAGTFLMGSPAGEVGREGNESPQHLVEVGALLVGETEVTQAQWKAVMKTTPFDCRVGCGDTMPAQSVSWYQAIAFMNELTRLENEATSTGQELTPCYEKDGESWKWIEPNCTGYRLPTESEWEYFARAGTTTAYSFGNDAAEFCKHGNGGDRSLKKHQKSAGVYAKHEWKFLECDDGAIKLAKTGSYESNPWGIFDMHGNVSEWTWNWHAEDYSTHMVHQGHSGPLTGEYRVLRGSSFMHPPLLLRSAYRDRGQPTDTVAAIGFRCVRAWWPPEPRSIP